MASSKDRQRALARAKLDRQLARRAARERRKRRVMAGLGAALAVVLIVSGVAWLGGAFDDEPADPAAADLCVWTPQSTETNPDLRDVGTPPTTGIPLSGIAPMTINTNQGSALAVALDVTGAPCAVASLSHLAQRKFYDNTECHEITAEGALRCGDPKGTGLGGPTYTFYSENVPVAPTPAPSASAAPPSATPLYPKGTVALHSDPQGNNGSQFLIFFKDFQPTADPQYSIIGSVTAGMDTLTAISKMPTVDNGSGDKVKPKEKVVVQTLTVGDAVPDAAPAPSASSQ